MQDARSDANYDDARSTEVTDVGEVADAGEVRDVGKETDAIDAIDASPGLDAAPSARCGDLPLCDDFESSRAGDPPTSATWSVVHPDCSGTGKVSVDESQAHSGKHSLRVDGGAGYCDHVFVSSSRAVLGVAGDQLWIRLFFRLDSAFGDAHTTFLAMKDEHDGGKDLRVGGQKGILMWNRSSDDATLPALSPVGIAASLAPTPGAWHCLELHVDRSVGHLETFVDDVLVKGLVVDGAATADLDGPWITARPSWRPSPVDFKLGWESYSDVTRTLWFDDVATGGARLGCAL